MGRLTSFHYLGVLFEVSRNPQKRENPVSVSMHPRCCARALGRVVTGRTNAVNTAILQCYLTRWAAWWQSVGNWDPLSLLAQWTHYARNIAPELAWLGSGLLAFETRSRLASISVPLS